mmetsp:Transcript_54941/g.143002  ORF Transcript_54941/g.143002 Transcript_54941/m.143002 type:complete len:355 (-) Transcript_54941:472-1536(-)
MPAPQATASCRRRDSARASARRCSWSYFTCRSSAAGSCAPSPSAPARASGARPPSRRSSFRWRLLTALPHVAEHSVKFDQSPQAQKVAPWHFLGHSSICSVAPGSQDRPPHAACCSIARLLRFCPPHFSQALQSSQSPHLQSVALHADLQGAAWHRAVSIMSSWQLAPPPDASCRMSRDRAFWPAPQVTSQAPQLSQSPTWQSTACSLPQSAPGLVHGPVCCRAPSQDLPPPWPCCAKPRDRRLTPAQAAVQSVHSDQSANWQSWAGVHTTPALQALCSVEAPVAGRPQCEASLATRRDLKDTPPSHVAEQGVQSCQSDHFPSTHSPLSHLSKLQGSISSLFCASHSRPPSRGA